MYLLKLFLLIRIISPNLAQEIFQPCPEQKSSQPLNLSGCSHFVISAVGESPKADDLFFLSPNFEPSCTVYTWTVIEEGYYKMVTINRQKLDQEKEVQYFTYDHQRKYFNFTEKLDSQDYVSSYYHLSLDSEKHLMIYKCLQINATLRHEFAIIFKNSAEPTATNHIDLWDKGHLSEFLKKISHTSLRVDDFSKHYENYEKMNSSNFEWNSDSICASKIERISLLILLFVVCAAIACLGAISHLCSKEENRVSNIS